MFFPLLQLLVGLVGLVYGGKRVVDDASAFAHEWGVPRLFIGVTFVAIGSSIPEIAASVYAGLYQSPQFVVGHIAGSATAQITVGVGVVALLSPLSLERSKIRLYGGGMVAAMGLMLVSVRSGRTTRLEGMLLVAAYLLFLAASYERLDLHDTVDRRVSDRTTGPRAAVGLLAGLVFVVAGGHLLVVGSREVALVVGVPPLAIGLITGLGTTAPEIVVAAMAVLKHRSGIAIGTLLGSNVTDPLFSFGLGAAVGGFSFGNPEVVMASTAYMLLASVIVVGIFLVRGEIGRRGAVCCISLYVPTFLV
ncbi:sodium:calcium antiporter [Halopenitus salinus]|uniref:Sodium:calcium antiporter n=1 Tax=Halopenitus salinus TaxID=1198295 RepID=A0ABD5V0Z0_9EURY